MRLKSKSAFTLVEVMIAVAITSMLIVAVMALLDPVNKIINMISSDSDAQNTVTAASSYIERQVQLSTGIELYKQVDLSAASDAVNMGAIMENFANKYTAAAYIPRAFIIKQEFNAAGGVTSSTLYSIRLKSPAITALADGELGELLKDPAWLEQYRVFNNSFYVGKSLSYDMGIDPVLSSEQIGNPCFLNMRVDAFEDGELAIKMPKDTVTRLINIGIDGGYTAETVVWSDSPLSTGNPDARDIVLLFNTTTRYNDTGAVEDICDVCGMPTADCPDDDCSVDCECLLPPP
jgi:prepilin-type N-terminal cleavage/methylation domain-containing protein